METIPLALFEHLDFSFLTDFPVFAPDPWRRTRDHKPPELLKGVLYCFSREIYSPEEIARELQDELLYLQCGFDKPPSHQSIRRFLTDVSLVVEDIFEYLVEQVAARDLLDNTFRIDSTVVHADPRDSEASWNYDPTAGSDDSDGDQSDESDQDTSNNDEQDEEGNGGYYFGYGYLVVTTGPKLPVAAAFTEQKQVDQEIARRVTQDALAVGDPNWMLGDSAFDMLNWHDDLIEEGVVPVAPYNERNTDDPYDIEYRVEQRIKKHSDTVGVWSKQLEETYEQRSQVERTIGACKDCGLGTPSVRGRVRVESHVFLALCLRLATAIANYERDANPGKTSVEVCQ
ncbi:transposase [Halalkaliarchaeum desulfuricum]|uniref:Transposase n=1 Tax=Halalkaliarchaeum desulfuricum TaxID=2055893 RepID=A0A343TL70_9EURY|nr:transposase [Halalkaliarchaeum desulfuricum]